MSAEESNVVQITEPKRARESKPRRTDRWLAIRDREQYTAGFNDGHAVGWKECQALKPRPFVEFAAGVVITAIGWGLDRWVF